MTPHKNPALPVEDRVTDLLGRMTLEEKAGLMCHGRMFPGSGAELVTERHLTHFAMMHVPSPAEMAEWNNTVQDLAAGTRLGIPVTFSSDPRHGFTGNPATAHTGGGFSPGPEPIGLAATDDPGLVERFAAMAGRELRAVGIRLALHPMADLATEPRWARISGTFGEDAERAARMIAAYIRGMQGAGVACMVKHFPGGGPQAAGEDPHFSYGRHQAYPGANLDYHLRPFAAAFAAGVSQLMPCYAIPTGSGLAEVGANFNRDVITGLARKRFGFDGVVCTDFNALTGFEIPGVVSLPPRNWGVEHLPVPDQLAMMLDAGVDQLGGETCPELLTELVGSGRVPESRLDVSVRRLLREKFRLGLFENPYADQDAAKRLVGGPDHRSLGREAQRRSLVWLTGGPREARTLYVENVDPDVAARYGQVVEKPEDADLAVIRLSAPYERREGLLESHFHAGSLEFPAAELDRLRALAAKAPAAFCVHLDRPAVLTGLVPLADRMLADFGAADEVVLDALLGRAPVDGVLPFDLPSSMRAVRESREDVPFDTRDPLFTTGHPGASARKSSTSGPASSRNSSK
ncbi:glycoside hydrolase family 3 protein [Nonomuraea endophytica]|uniref:glycoside hydrolase family 3 protein n=1 Tax=Nonomuraea endophytica TaxID=714136 RepID=UPI0037C8F8CE